VSPALRQAGPDVDLPSVLVAPDSFKGTFTAATVAAAAGRGLRRAGVRPDLCPVADGGEGTLNAVIGRLGGRLLEVEAHDPLGRPVRACLGLFDDDRVAVVESASASGFTHLRASERDPWAASSAGTGEMIMAAVASGAQVINVAVGGTATVDGGAGAIEVVQARGGPRDARLVVLCDVVTPFESAARTFGPQKGADGQTVDRLEQRMDALAERLPRDPRGVPGTGAGGGLSGGLWTTFGAVVESGAAWVLDHLDFDARLRTSGAVVTGEGRLDAQSLEGKLVGEIAERARHAGVSAHAIVGRDDLSDAGKRALRLGSVSRATDVAGIEAAGELLGRALASELCGTRS
jgi:glycerate kinase